jgi:hypothetical protein
MCRTGHTHHLKLVLLKEVTTRPHRERHLVVHDAEVLQTCPARTSVLRQAVMGAAQGPCRHTNREPHVRTVAGQAGVLQVHQL